MCIRDMLKIENIDEIGLNGDDMYCPNCKTSGTMMFVATSIKMHDVSKFIHYVTRCRICRCTFELRKPYKR